MTPHRGGGAVAEKGPHKVRFAANVNSAGSITLTDPEGKTFRSHPLALYYMDATDGRYEMIGQVKDSTPVLVSENELVYPDAFTGFKCDLRYRYTRNGLEQDVILRQSPPPPEHFGMRAETARICVVTEFIAAPEPGRRSQVLRRLAAAAAGGPPLVAPDLVEETLDFGTIKSYQGSAFPLGVEAGPDTPEPVAQTGKTWENWEGRNLLIERTDYEQIKSYVERLPKSAALRKERTDKMLQASAPGSISPRIFPASPPPATTEPAAPVLRLALDGLKQPGFVLDYQMVTTITGQVFRGDITYYVSNSTVTLSGTTVLEGGSVIKLGSNAVINISGAFDCRTDPYRPAFFVGKDDDSVGEIITGSTGNPGLSRYGSSRALQFTVASSSNWVSNIRIRNASRAVTASGSGTKVYLWHSQIRATDFAINNGAGSAVMAARNVLIQDATTAFFGGSGRTNIAEHATAHRVGYLVNSNATATVYLTNSLLISVTNKFDSFTGSSNATNLSDSGIFQAVGAGAAYLAVGSTNRDAGTTNINPTLLADLQRRTTYPPVVLSNGFSSNTNLPLQAARDADTPDRGYHYDPLDYAASGIGVTNSVVTLAEGVSFGVHGGSGGHGLLLADGAILVAQGSPLNPCRLVRYNCVQEQSVTNWSASSMGRALVDASWGGSPRPLGQLRFTEFSAPAGGGGEHFEGDYASGPDTALFSFTHCQFHGGRIESVSANLAFTNCLFERVTLTDYSTYSDFHNCTFFGGTAYIDGSYGGHRAFQNLFDQTVIIANYVTNDYNGYVTNFDRLTAYYPNYGSNDTIVSALAFESGLLGRFHIPSNAPVCNAGGISASNIGLYHFTAVTNQTKEGTSVVDLGFHYVAMNSNGTFPDYDYDGVADYLEDADGNGLGDIGETLWLHSDTDYDGRSDGDEPLDGTDPLDSASVKLVRLGHWRFDDLTLAGDEGQQPDPAFNFNVIPPVTSWSGNAVYVTNLPYTVLGYREIETNGRPNINCRNGTIRFWFKPDWTNSTAGGVGKGGYASFIDVGDSISGYWGLFLPAANGANIEWYSVSNGVDHDLAVAPIGLTAGRWHQIAMTYSPTNTALFVNGQVLSNLFCWDDRPRIIATSERYNTTAGGIFNYPSAETRALGFRLGCVYNGGGQAGGQFDELETFNHPLTPQQIAREFHTLPGVAMATNDFDYDGRSDFMEAYVDGTATNNASSVVGGRLAYWRFNSTLTNLLGDTLQAPIYTNGIQLAASWSSNVVVIPDGSSARLVYRDVETNGSANFNARSGAVRFWFRPNWSWDGTGSDGSFLYLGNSTSETLGRWDFGIKGPGKKIWLRTSTNGTSTTLFEASFDFLSNRWCQIALNYGPSAVALYINGSLVTNRAVGISQWPALADRANGLALGNNHAGDRPINGALDEVETFNRQLTASEIERNYDSMHASDNDLNSVPDLLEDQLLAAPVPFAGFPFVITGTVETEQFDLGGEGVAYHSLGGNTATNDYRASAMQIVTNTTDLGAGFLVDNLRANEWLKYTLDLRVAQNYAVDVRAAGLGTGGVFHVEFATNATSAAYTNTGPLALTTTNWTNVIRVLLPLRAGTNIMKLVMDTNSSAGAVGRFNYLSIYPSWVEGTTNLAANVNVTGMTPNDASWTAATNNAARIQIAIDSLSTTGTVTIPSGTFYLAQKLPQEAADKDAQNNTAVFVSKSNVRIQGAGKTNTVLIAHNRATAMFYFGITSGLNRLSVTNVTLSEFCLEGRTHLVAVADTSGGFTNCWEDGIITPSDSGPDLGSLVVALGKDNSNLIRNILITNCLFRNASVVHFVIPRYVRDVAFRSCDFILREGSNGAVYYRTNVSPCHTNLSVTAPWTGVSVLARAPGCENLVMLDCTFNGNPGMTVMNSNFPVDAGDGIFWAMAGGNWFIGRCAITNYLLEGVQFGAGPAATTGNQFHTLASVGAATALYAFPFWDFTPTGATNDYVFYLVGNSISGGRSGYKGLDTQWGDPLSEADVHVSGNALDLFNAFPVSPQGSDGLGGTVIAGMVRRGMVSGNVMASGGVGGWWFDGSSSSILLKNDFASASYQGLAYWGTNGTQHRFLILRNAFNQGVRHHLRPTWEDGRAYFFGENLFKSGTNIVSPFITPFGAPVHFR